MSLRSDKLHLRSPSRYSQYNQTLSFDLPVDFDSHRLPAGLLVEQGERKLAVRSRLAGAMRDRRDLDPSLECGAYVGQVSQRFPSDMGPTIQTMWVASKCVLENDPPSRISPTTCRYEFRSDPAGRLPEVRQTPGLGPAKNHQTYTSSLPSYP